MNYVMNGMKVGVEGSNTAKIRKGFYPMSKGKRRTS